ncbi:MAG TPA: PKD domain-containing protein [Acidobacteriaceae bacterium]
MFRTRLILCVLLLAIFPASALERPEITFKVFQFPPNIIPRIDGNDDDWAMVPESYAIGMDQLENTEVPGGHGTNRDPKDLDVKVKVGWVKGMNRLYFLYEAYDNYWDFSRPDLHNDIFEVVVDGDLSGGPLIDMYHRDVWTPDAVGQMSTLDPRFSSSDAYFAQQGAHAQNYHIFTPAEGKDWTMDWGCAQYTKELPYANHAIHYNFKPGEPGKLVLEFWITPFDYAGCEGPERAIESVLTENKLIGLSWAVIDYDDVNSNQRKFWNLSHKQTFFGNASQLVGFRLMPLEPQFRKSIDAHWSFKVIDTDQRIVAFKDQSQGEVTAWKWDFGDGTTSTEQSPTHQYKDRPGREGIYTVILTITGPGGTSRMAKVWDVHVRG